MTTLFLIQVTPDNGEPMTCGPYLSLKEATLIFTEHLSTILLANKKTSASYIAELIEAIPTNDSWEIVEIKITSSEVYRLDAE